MIAREDDWVGVGEFARGLLSSSMVFPHMTPSVAYSPHWMPRRLRKVLPVWCKCVGETLALPPQGVVAIDGKTMRRTFGKASKKAAIQPGQRFRQQQSSGIWAGQGG